MEDAAAVEGALTPEPDEPPMDSHFYRAIDWWTFAITAPLILLGYWLTLTPDIPLDDAGEWVTAAMWPGVPNPPGYPIWTYLTWIFIHLVPVSNIAYRVALASALEASLTCGICALVASRFTAFLIEGIVPLNNLESNQQSFICSVAGIGAASSLGLNGTFWRHAVVPSIYPLPTLSLAVTLAVLLRWMYLPTKRRYLYWVAFLFGVCVVNHLSLIVAAMGLEIAVIAADPSLGRDLLAMNVLFWISGLCMDGWIAPSPFDAASPRVFVLFNIIGAFSFAGAAVQIFTSRKFLTEWKSVLAMVLCCLSGVGFYFVVPLASMTNPPMNWGYARIVEGFYHTISRGQYDMINPADVIHSPGIALGQIATCLLAVAGEFGAPYVLVALIPFFCVFKMGKLERKGMVALTAVFLCMGVLMTVLMNPTRERQTADLIKVFYMPSFVPIAIWIGCGFGLAGAWLAVKYPAACKEEAL